MSKEASGPQQLQELIPLLLINCLKMLTLKMGKEILSSMKIQIPKVNMYVKYTHLSMHIILNMNLHICSKFHWKPL